MNTSTDLARSYVRFLIESGISDFVLSPGSRNAPLSIALNEAFEKNLIDLHIKIDERGAAFFAVGISKASNKYVAVICTSGTAAANYTPAALEALHGGNKLLLITADRPARLRKTGANQTTNQVDIYQDIKSIDATTFAPIEFGAGPIHLNIQFDEPLLTDDKSDWLAGLQIREPKTQSLSSEKLSVSGNGVVVVGHDKGGFTPEEISAFSQNLIILSEDPLSFPNAITHASVFLADEKVREYLKPDYVIVIGRTTLSRSINAFVASAPAQYAIDKQIEKVDTNRVATKKFISLPNLEVANIEESYRTDFESASKASEMNLAWGEQQFAKTFSENLPNDSALFVGSSRPIRDIEGFANPRGGLKVFANRGLAGIDGNISTIFGIAENFNQTFAVLGDLTFLHDLNALISPTTQDCKIFLLDNNGGGIFSTLPQAGVEGFERIFGTPHNQNLEKIIAGFGINVEKIKNESDLSRAIIHPTKGLVIYIIEVPNREEMSVKLKEYYASVSKAVRIGFNLA